MQKTIALHPTTSRMLLASLALTVCAGATRAQLEMVKDLNRQAVSDPSSNPDAIVSLGGSFLFAADAQDGHGRELYASTGAPGTTRLVLDIATGAASSDPRDLVVAGSAVFFTADDGVHGQEIWASDGTTAGTRLVKDIRVGPSPGAFRGLAAVGTTVYFAAEDGSSGRELWKTDGTAAGTVLVRDIASSWNAGHISWLTPFGNRIAFAASGALGLELWISDGTATGTVQLRDIAPGPADALPQNLTVIGNELWFAARTPTHGLELWKSDGTSGGTVMVADIQPGAGSSSPGAFASLGTTGIVLFQATDARGAELWRTDGSPAGTSLLADLAGGSTPRGIPYSSYPADLTPLGNVILFTAGDGRGNEEVLRTDGTPAGTQRVGSLTPHWSRCPPVQVGNRLLIHASRRALPTGAELFLTDGTTAGTSLVKDIRPGILPSSVRWLTPGAGGRLVFSACDGTHGSELWVTDGTPSGTVLADNIAKPPAGHTLGSQPHELIDAFGRTFFFANTNELWQTDTTTAGTVLLQRFQAGPGLCPCPAELTLVEEQLFFRVRSVLWKSDGTRAGTVAIKDVTPGSTGAWPSHFTAMGCRLYFAAESQAAGRELWVSDGTTAGTTLLKDLRPGPADSFLTDFVAVGNTLFFVADDGTHGLELWKSDGTSAGTVLVRDIVPGSGSARPGRLASFRGAIYFQATTAAEGAELWRSDGTDVGTVLVHDLDPGPGGSWPSHFTPVGDLLFFLGQKWKAGQGFVPEAWRTDGTAAGTILVSPRKTQEIVALDDLALLFADASLLRSDGTANGTLLLRSFAVAPSVVRARATGSRFVWFSAEDGTSGTELWRTDGTAAGTQRVRDLNAGPDSSDPRELTLSRGWLLFAADDGVSGQELWKYAPGASSKAVGTGCAAASRWHEIRSGDPVLGQRFTVTGSGALPGVSTWLAAGLGPAVSPLGAGCTAYLVPGSEVLLGPFLPGSSAWIFRTPLANDPALLGLTVAIQVAQAPTKGPLGLDLTNAIALTFGY